MSDTVTEVRQEDAYYLLIEITDPDIVGSVDQTASNSSDINIISRRIGAPNDSLEETTSPQIVVEFDQEREEQGAKDSESESEWRDYIKDVSLKRNSSGRWTARDVEWELTAVGDTAEEALDKLGEVIAASQGEAGHEPTDNELEALGLDPETARDDTVDDVPSFME